MRWFRISILLTAIMKGTVFAASPLHFDAGAGAGFNDNLNHAGSGNEKEGSFYGAAWLTLGASKDAFGDDRLFFNVGYDGTYYTSFSDLTVNTVAAEAGILHTLSDAAFVKLAANLGTSDYKDNERDAEFSGVLLSLRAIIAPEFDVILGYRYTDSDAEEPVYSYSTHRFSLSGEFEIASKTRLIAGYAFESGEDIFYREITGAPFGSRMRRPSDTFGSNQEVLREDAKAHIFSVDWEREFGKGAYVQLGYVYSEVQSDLENYHNQVVSGGAGYRF